jgi:hypothetical protein
MLELLYFDAPLVFVRNVMIKYIEWARDRNGIAVGVILHNQLESQVLNY